MPAEPDAVAAALRNYDLAHAATTQAARDCGQPGPRTEVEAADQEFARVRDLLAPLFPADDSQRQALDLSIDFRVNRSAEQRANAIIEWNWGSMSLPEVIAEIIREEGDVNRLFNVLGVRQ